MPSDNAVWDIRTHSSRVTDNFLLMVWCPKLVKYSDLQRREHPFPFKSVLYPMPTSTQSISFAMLLIVRSQLG